MVASPFLQIEEDTEPLRVNPPRSLRASDFLVGNPGIQGSNLVCGLSVLLEASLFDESLPNCTDRDPCICDARPWTSHRYPGSSASFTRTAPSMSPSEPAREPRRCGSRPPVRVRVVDLVAAPAMALGAGPERGPVRSQARQRNAAGSGVSSLSALSFLSIDIFRSGR